MKYFKLILINLLSFLSFLCFKVLCSTYIPSHVNLGTLIPNSNPQNTCRGTIAFYAAIIMAIDDINNKTDGRYDDLLPQTVVKTAFRTPQILFSLAVDGAVELAHIDGGNGIMGLIGPLTARGTTGASPVFVDYGSVPLVGFWDRSPVLGASRQYTNFLRVIPGTYAEGRAIAAIIKQFFDWTKVSVLYTNDDYSYSANFFKSYADELGITVLSQHSFHSNERNFASIIEDTKKVGARIFVILMSTADAYALIKQGKEAGLFSEGTQIIGCESMSDITVWRSLGNETDAELGDLLKGLITVLWKEYKAPTQEANNFVKRWRSRPPIRPKRVGNKIVCDNTSDSYHQTKVYSFISTATRLPVCCGFDFTLFAPDSSNMKAVMYAYDAVIALAKGLHNIYHNNNTINVAKPMDLLRNLQNNVSFTGLTGEVSFSSRFKGYDMDVGGRNSGLYYQILNFQTKILPQTSTVVASIQPFAAWQSEEGFTSCDGQLSPSSKFSDACHNVTFNTKYNTIPVDSPNPTLEYMSRGAKVLLRLFCAISIIWYLFDFLCIILFHSRRLMKMSQPTLSTIALLGSMCAVASVVLTTIDLTQSICLGIFWTSHLTFLLIFSTLVVRAWRVFSITSSLKKVVFGDAKCVKIVSLLLSFGVIVMIFETAFRGIELSNVTIESNQFENRHQLNCSYRESIGVYVLYAYEAFIILLGLYMCWRIRNVNLTVCDTNSILQASLTVIIIVIVFSLITLINMTPIIKQFALGMAIIVTTFRVIWILDSRVTYLVLFGWDLDKSLNLQHSSWSILNITPGYSKSKKIGMEEEFSTERDVESPSHRVELARFSKEKNYYELAGEITRATRELQILQKYLISLENMKYAVDGCNLSQSMVETSTQYKANDEKESRESGGAPEVVETNEPVEKNEVAEIQNFHQ